MNKIMQRYEPKNSDIPYYNKLTILEQKVKEFEKLCRENTKLLPNLSRKQKGEVLAAINSKSVEVSRDLSYINIWIQDGSLSSTEIKIFQNIGKKLKRQYTNSLTNINNIIQRKSFQIENYSNTDFDSELEYYDLLEVLDTKNRANLDNIYSRELYTETKELEKSITELHQMFIEMTNLIDIQGELLFPIQQETSYASHNIEHAIEILQTADKHAIAIRKKKLLIVGMVIATVAVVIMTVAAIGTLCASAMGLFA